MGQQTVSNTFLATGIPGDFYSTENQGAFGAIINSASESANVVGRVVLHVEDSDDQVGIAEDGNIAGILMQPKNSVRNGLDAQAFISNDSQVQIARRGYLVVTLPAVADIGDWVYFSDTTGSLITAAPGAVPTAAHSRLPGGKVAYFNVAAAGVAVIYLDVDAGDTTLPTA